MDPIIAEAVKWMSGIVGQVVIERGIDQGMTALADDWVDQLTEFCDPELSRFGVDSGAFATWLALDDVEVLLNSGRPDDVERFVAELVEQFPAVEPGAWAIAGTTFSYFLTVLDPSHATAVLADRVAALHTTVDDARSELLAASYTVIASLSRARTGLIPPPIDTSATDGLLEAVERVQLELARLVRRTAGSGLQVDWRGTFAQSMSLRPAHIVFATTNSSSSDVVTIRSIECVVERCEESDRIHHVLPEGLPQTYRYKVSVKGPGERHEVLDKAKMHVLRPYETDVFDIEIRAPEGMDVELSVYLTWNVAGGSDLPSRDLVNRVVLQFGTFSPAALLERARSMLVDRADRKDRDDR